VRICYFASCQWHGMPRHQAQARHPTRLISFEISAALGTARGGNGDGRGSLLQPSAFEVVRRGAGGAVPPTFEGFTYMPLKKLLYTCVPLESSFAPMCHPSKLVCPLCHSVQFPSNFCRVSYDMWDQLDERSILPFESLRSGPTCHSLFNILFLYSP
jgi:hypothetical protein